MLTTMLNIPTINVLESAMQASNLRQQVISNNIANVNTPNFKRKDTVFESILAKAIYSPNGNNTDLPLIRTNERHLTTDENSLQPAIITDNSTTMRTDGNNVDPDTEMAALAKNTLYYNALVREMNVNFTNLNTVVKDQQ